jgi:hypothetical protein
MFSQKAAVNVSKISDGNRDMSDLEPDFVCRQWREDQCLHSVSYIPGMSNFKQAVIDFLVSKLPVICHPLPSSYLALSKNIGKNNTTHDVCCKNNIY